MLYLNNFEKAIHSLLLALEEYDRNPSDFIRDSCIQRFEYTYDLSHKMLKRHLELEAASLIEIEELSFQNLIRTGSEKGLLLSGWDIWSSYRKARNITSHGYNSEKADEVFKMIPDFLNEARYLYDRLRLKGKDLA